MHRRAGAESPRRIFLEPIPREKHPASNRQAQMYGIKPGCMTIVPGRTI